MGALHKPNPWLITIVVSIATFMEVLDTTIANVALPYIAGGLAISADEASWVVTTYLSVKRHHSDGEQFSGEEIRPQTVLPLLRPALHHQFSALCNRVEFSIPAAVPHTTGAGRRRHGSGVAVDTRRCLSS